MQSEKIVGIKYVGKMKTLDIEVDNDKHVFMANGIATKNSHSCGYSYNAYLYSAYTKAHFPRAFYISKLKFITNTTDATEIINDAKKMGVNICPPDLRYFNCDPILVDSDIIFPLTKVKYVGEKGVLLMKEAASKYTSMPTYKQWILDILSSANNSRLVKSIILSGGLDFLSVPRSRMLADFEAASKLTKKALSFCKESDQEILKDLSDILEQGTGKGKILVTKVSAKKISTLIEEFKFNTQEKDNRRKKSSWEKEFLGRELSCMEFDAFGNADCSELSLGNVDGPLKIPVKIERFKIFTNHKEQELAYLTVYDLTGEAGNVRINSKEYSLYKDLIFEGNNICLSGKFNQKTNLLYVEKVVQL